MHMSIAQYMYMYIPESNTHFKTHNSKTELTCSCYQCTVDV